MSAIERAYLAGFAQAAKEIQNGIKAPQSHIAYPGSMFYIPKWTPGFRKGYFAGWDVAK